MSTSSTERTQDQSMVEQASAKVHDAASTAQEKADELARQGKSRLSEQLDRRTTEAGGQARTIADALRRSTSEMQVEGAATPARLANEAAGHIERLGGYLEQKNGDDILRDIESFARRRPWMIAGLSVLGGIAASRFLKASSQQRYSAGGYGGYRAVPRGGAYGSTAGYGGTTDYGNGSPGIGVGTASQSEPLGSER